MEEVKKDETKELTIIEKMEELVDEIAQGIFNAKKVEENQSMLIEELKKSEKTDLFKDLLTGLTESLADLSSKITKQAAQLDTLKSLIEKAKNNKDIEDALIEMSFVFGLFR